MPKYELLVAFIGDAYQSLGEFHSARDAWEQMIFLRRAGYYGKVRVTKRLCF